MYTLSLGFPQPSWHRITCINQTNPKDPRAASRLSLWQCCLSFQRLISHPGWRSACTDGWIDGLRVKIKHIISHIDKRQKMRLHAATSLLLAGTKREIQTVRCGWCPVTLVRNQFSEGGSAPMMMGTNKKSDNDVQSRINKVTALLVWSYDDATGGYGLLWERRSPY